MHDWTRYLADAEGHSRLCEVGFDATLPLSVHHAPSFPSPDLSHWDSTCLSFKGAVYPDTKRYFPPTIGALLAWSTLFRDGGTFRNYLGYVKTGCMLTNACTKVCIDFY